MVGLMIFGAFAVGLRAANLETNVEKLWVEGKDFLLFCFLSFFLPFHLSAVLFNTARLADNARRGRSLLVPLNFVGVQAVVGTRELLNYTHSQRHARSPPLRGIRVRFKHTRCAGANCDCAGKEGCN